MKFLDDDSVPELFNEYNPQPCAIRISLAGPAAGKAGIETLRGRAFLTGPWVHYCPDGDDEIWSSIQASSVLQIIWINAKADAEEPSDV